MKIPWTGLLIVALLAVGCSKTTEPTDNSLPADVRSYQYTAVQQERYYELTPVPDTCNGCDKDTLIDSLDRLLTDQGVSWSVSYRAIRHFVRDTSGNLVPAGDDNAKTRREGTLADTLLVDPSLRHKLLVAPVQAGTSWFVDDGNAISALIVGEETLPLQIGTTRTWHVLRGAVGDEWWAPGLGRVQYEEVEVGGSRIRGVLIAVGSIN
jgi:hypothetical protein